MRTCRAGFVPWLGLLEGFPTDLPPVHSDWIVVRDPQAALQTGSSPLPTNSELSSHLRVRARLPVELDQELRDEVESKPADGEFGHELPAC